MQNSSIYPVYIPMPFRVLYRVFTSLKTSVVIMGLMCVCYLLGTLFPQGADYDAYVKAGGRYLWLVEKLDLLHLFTSPLFFFLTALLVLNLTLCILSRLLAFRRRRELLPEESVSRLRGLIKVPEDRSFEEIQEKLLQCGFRFVDADDRQYVYGKGLPYWWLSWLYHLGMVVAVVGFFITYLSAHEGEITLYKDREVQFSKGSPDTPLNRVLRALGRKHEEVPVYRLRLKEFRTEYYETLDFEYPETVLSRMAIGLGLKRIVPSEEADVSAKMYSTQFEFITPEGDSIQATTEVNSPFRHSGITLYQVGYEQRISLKVDGEDREVDAFRPFEIEGLEGRFLIPTVRHGQLHRKDGSVVPLTPSAPLYRIDNGSRKKVAVLKISEPVEVGDVEITLLDFKEASVLSYRVDPGVPVVAVATGFVFLGLLIRVYGNFYRVRVIQMDGSLYLLVSTRGLLADRRKVLRRLGIS